MLCSVRLLRPMGKLPPAVVQMFSSVPATVKTSSPKSHVVYPHPETQNVMNDIFGLPSFPNMLPAIQMDVHKVNIFSCITY